MHKVLIANRGEIACRIIRCCQEQGFATVAIYSEVDATARHVQGADEAWPVGPAPVRESYLKIEAILDVARQSGARFVHPGYGLLAENAGFAAAVRQAGLIWVGPDAATIAAMADKGRARDLAIAIDVPVLPGSPRLDAGDADALAAAADQVGFPLLVKATGGGGGIGMRLVASAEGLLKTAQAVSALAERTFGDSGIFLERHVARARHIEVQVFGLGDGRVFHLFDRECSIQRRFQKVIEEAPAPGLPPETRAAMAEAARRLAASQDYAGAGTVEFILDDDTGRFFFLEMNTRIQVEHPVTEMITGHDIVALQLALAAGEPLDHWVDQTLTWTGHALECRLYAERPEKNFLPSPGTLDRFGLPDAAPGLRIDTGFVEGDTITPFYDPMIAKVITSGADRAAAVTAMQAALDRIEIAGIRTNLTFLKRVIRHPAFLAGTLDTRFIDRHKAVLTAP